MRSLRWLALLAIIPSNALRAQQGESARRVVIAAPSPIVADIPGVARRFFTANGARLQYLDFGGNGPPVVLLAGLGNTAWIWSDFGRRLVHEGYRTVALTRRAHGESEAPAGGYNVDTLATDVIALLDSLGVTQAHFIGHSLAGAELTRIAARYPARVRSLVYIDAAYDRASQRRYDSLHPPPQLGPSMTESDRASVDAYLAYQRRARPDLARFWGAAVERDYSASLAVDSGGSVHWRHPFRAYGAIIDDAARASPDYTLIRAPSLAIYATVSQNIAPAGASTEQLAHLERFERDNHAPWLAKSIAQFQAGAKSGRVELLGGVHHLFLDRPEETLRVIMSFLRDATRSEATR